ncbi:DUF3093 domain-containing protein [Brachybacterium hainanense]|uniref:DUF3093 domain-containing protein n=1 Tax=Brachybacterium hainanense TaxID=1541174 RepID=A0ABV6RDW7_9MICO
MTEAASRPADPAAVLFRERLSPSVGTWIVLVAFGSILGVILVPLSTTLAAVVAGLGIAAMIVFGVAWSPVLEVTREHLTAGRAQVPVALLEEPVAVEGEQWQELMGVGFEPLAFHCTRGWIRTGVRVPLDDDDDPTPAWVMSSRRPQDLVLALQVARSER